MSQTKQGLGVPGLDSRPGQTHDSALGLSLRLQAARVIPAWQVSVRCPPPPRKPRVLQTASGQRPPCQPWHHPLPWHMGTQAAGTGCPRLLSSWAAICEDLLSTRLQFSHRILPSPGCRGPGWDSAVPIVWEVLPFLLPPSSVLKAPTMLCSSAPPPSPRLHPVQNPHQPLTEPWQHSDCSYTCHHPPGGQTTPSLSPRTNHASLPSGPALPPPLLPMPGYMRVSTETSCPLTLKSKLAATFHVSPLGPLLSGFGSPWELLERGGSEQTAGSGPAPPLLPV